MSVYCPDCDYSTDEPHRFCPSCGATLVAVIRCRSCQTELATSYRFCFACGTPRDIDTHDAPDSPIERRSQPDRPFDATGTDENPRTGFGKWFSPSTLTERASLGWVSAAKGFAARLILEAQKKTSLSGSDEFDRLSARSRVVIEIITVSALTLLALALRIYDLDVLPLGFEPNESGLSVDALRVLDDWWIGTWTPVHGGQPTGFTYWTALFLAIGEPSIYWARLASVIPGVATIPVAYILLRRVFPYRVAALATAMLAVSIWFIIPSRMGVQMMLTVFLGLSAMLVAHVTLQTRQIAWGLVGGIVLGLGLYSFKAFLPFFVGIWGMVALLMLLSSKHRNAASALFLVSSAIVTAPLLNVYLFTDFIGDELAKDYYGNVDFWNLQRYPARVLELLLFVSRPLGSGTWDGTGGDPILHTAVIQAVFWIGLAVVLLNIRRREYQLLLLGWFVAALAAIVIDGAESRRYLFAIFFVITTVAIGFNVFAQLAVQYSPWVLRKTLPSHRNLRHFGFAVGAVLVVGFCTHVFLTERHEFQKWSVGPVLWYFESELFDALKLVDNSGDRLRVVSLNGRTRITDERVEFLYPGLETIEAAVEHGGPGAISADMVQGNTAIITFGDYMKMIDELEAMFPGHVKVERYSDELGAPDRTLVYIAYLIRDS